MNDLPSAAWAIRAASDADFMALQAVERAAFATLKAAGAVAGQPVASSSGDLLRYQQAGLLFAAFDNTGTPRGFAGGYIAQGWLHIAEMDVHPDWQRQGIGRQLLETLLHAGREKRCYGATLTTDRLAAFNAPFYASLGFMPVSKSVRPGHLDAILAAEITGGLDPARRVAMVSRYA
ncbi:GNAT family N-acetyltransferase [Kosakonia sp. BK9b]